MKVQCEKWESCSAGPCEHRPVHARIRGCIGECTQGRLDGMVSTECIPLKDIPMSAQQKISNFAELEADWDHDGAKPIDATCIITAGRTLLALQTGFEEGIAVPDVVPTVTGGVQLEWHGGGVDMVLSIEPVKEAE